MPLDVCIVRVGPVPRTQALALGAFAHPLPVQHHLLGGTVTWVEQLGRWQDAGPTRLGYFKNSILGKASRLGFNYQDHSQASLPLTLEEVFSRCLSSGL